MRSLSISSRSLTVATIVAANMLGLAATDLYLPSVPFMPEIFGTNVESAQFTLVAFSAGFALSQILIGAMGDLYNRRRVLAGSLLAFVPATAWCALSPDIASFIAARAAQGVSASASAALTAPMIRQLYDEAKAVHALSVIGGIDAIVPAIAPILGAWIFFNFGWQANFWAVAAIGVPITLAALLAIPDDRPETHHTSLWPVLRGYGYLVRHRVFLGYGVSHGLALGGFLALVFSTPYLISAHMGGGPREFIYCQIIWVGVFLAAAASTGKGVARFGPDRLILLGNLLQIGGALLVLGYALSPLLYGAGLHWLGLALTATPFAVGLGLRGGAGFTRAIDAVPSHGGRASALIVFFSLGFAALGTGMAAPFLKWGLGPVALTMLAHGVLALWVLSLAFPLKRAGR